MNKDDALKKITDGDGDFKVFTEAEHKEFLDNLRDTEPFKKEIDKRLGDVHKKYDDDLFTITGKRKQTDQRTFDFMKIEYQTLQDSAEELRVKNEKLEEAGKDGSGAEALKLAQSELDSVKKKHQTSLDEWKNKYESLEKNGEQMRILNEFDRSMQGFKFKDVAIIPEDVRNAMISNAKAELSKSASFVDGKLVFLDSEGDILRDKESLNVLTAKEVLSEKLKSIIDVGRKQEGVDIKEPDIEKDKDGNVIVTISLPDSVKTNVDLSEHLHSLGMKSGSEEYRAAYAKYIEKVKKIT